MRYLILFFAISAVPLFAQDNQPAESSSRFRFGINVSADYCYRNLIAEDTTGIGFVYSNAKDTEIPGIGYTAGITSSYSLNDHWSIDAGLKYSLNRYRTKDFIFTDVNGEKIGDGYFAILNRFISMPIGIQYSSSPGPFSFVGGVAIVPEYALGVWTRGNYNLPDTYDYIDTYTKDENTNYRSFVVSANAHAGVQFRTGKFSTQILPNYKLCLMKQASDVQINRKLWSAGLEVRLLYSI